MQQQRVTENNQAGSPPQASRVVTRMRISRVSGVIWALDGRGRREQSVCLDEAVRVSLISTVTQGRERTKAKEMVVCRCCAQTESSEIAHPPHTGTLPAQTSVMLLSESHGSPPGGCKAVRKNAIPVPKRNVACLAQMVALGWAEIRTRTGQSEHRLTFGDVVQHLGGSAGLTSRGSRQGLRWILRLDIPGRLAAVPPTPNLGC